MRALVSDILVSRLEALNLNYPVLSPDQLSELREAGELLNNEDKK
jgi:hypothetical protein